jgi:hypothetical protein
MAMLEQQPGPVEPVFTIGDRLRKARDHAGIKSAVQMAELLSERFGETVSKSTVLAWEREDNQPTRRGVRLPDVVRAYAEVCNVPEPWFWSHSGYDAPLTLVSGVDAVQGTLFRDADLRLLDPVPA